MKRSTRLLAAAASVTIAVSACGGDSTGTNAGDPLSVQEALDVYAALNQALAQAFGGVAGPAASPGATMDAIPAVTANCPAGGNVRVSGSYDSNINSQTGMGDFSFTFKEEINDCKVTSGGNEFTVNGDPDISITGDLTIGENFSFTGTYAMTGGFGYTGDGRSGSCAMDVSVDYGDFSVSGSICGQNISAVG